eukprot:Gb_31233 [translate_table: standard]
MGIWISREKARAIGMAGRKAKEIVSSNPVVVFSKKTCPYCTQVKLLLSSLGAKIKVIELDTESDGSKILLGLFVLTGQRKVPSVFVGGTHIGGLDATVAKRNNGELMKLLSKVGVVGSS